MKIETPLLYAIVLASLIITGALFVMNLENARPTFNPDVQPGTGIMPAEFISSTLLGIEGDVKACFNHNGQIYVFSRGNLYEYNPAMFTLENIFPIEFEHGIRGAFTHGEKLYLLGTDDYLYPYDLTYLPMGVLEPSGRVVKTSFNMSVTGLSAHGDYIYAIHTDGHLRKYYRPELFYGITYPRDDFDLAAEASYVNSLSCFTLTDYIAFLMSDHRYHEYLAGPFSEI